MTTYYIRPDGDDDNAGTGPSAVNAWATWAKAVATVAAGNTVYIAPGTYREVVTMVTAGSAGNIISWLGDPYCVQFTDMNSGYVRLTGCDADELPSQTTILSSGVNDYQVYKNLVIDGTASDAGNTAVNLGATPNSTMENCLVMASAIGILGNNTTPPTVINCFVVSGYRSIYSCNSYNCVAIGTYASFYQGSAYDCIGIGGGYDAASTACFHTCTPVYNCLAISAESGYRSTTLAVIKNSIAMCCHYGFTGSSLLLTVTNGLSIGCTIAAYGTDSGNKLNIGSIKYIYCNTASRGTTYETGTIGVANHCGYANLYKINELAHALRFDLMNERNWSDDTVSWTGDGVDLLGKIRRLGDGTIDVGPVAYSNNLPEYTTIKNTAPAIKIAQKGELIFSRTVKDGVSYTVKVWVNFDLDGGSDYPVLAVSALDGCIAADSDTAAGGGTYEQLSVTFTPTYDGTVQVKCQALEMNADAYAIFSDLEL